MKLSIIIPCYNESGSLKDLFKKCCSPSNISVEYIIVDNGSTDGGFDLLDQFEIPNYVKVLRVKENQGYGNGILAGLNIASGEILSWTHADLQTDPEDVIKGYFKFKRGLINKTAVVKGVRKNRNFFDYFFTFCMSCYCLFVLNKWMDDINAQPKIFHKDFINDFKNAPKDFSLDLFWYFFFLNKRIKVNKFPVYFKKRLYGVAKGGGSIKGKLKLIRRTLSYINSFKNNGVYNT